MQAQIDQVCDEVGVWPHADLAGHAHSYQRFTRTRKDGSELPYIVCGNGGHNVQSLARSAGQVLRAPQIIRSASPTDDQIVLENYDDQNYGYLRVVVTAAQLRIEYHPAGDGAKTKSPDDHVTVDLKTRRLVHFGASDMGAAQAALAVRRLREPGT